VLGVLSAADLVGLEARSPFALRHAILSAHDEEELVAASRRLRQLFLSLLGAGISPLDIGRVLSLQVDSITQRLIELSISRRGPAPAAWAWLVLGSAARREFTLGSDVENALAYDDTGEEVDGYFALLKKAIQLDSASSDAYNNIGLFYSRAGNNALSIQMLNKAMQLNPKDYNAPYNMGNTYAAMGDFKTAIEYYQKALSLNPNSEIAWVNLGNSYGAMKDYPNALNGLQIENSGAVTKIGAAVDASASTIQMAVEQGIDLLIVHHGLFWPGLQPVTGSHYRALKLAVEHNLALYSAHLPLDLHPTIGNNVLLAAALGFEKTEPFLEMKGEPIGRKIPATYSWPVATNRVPLDQSYPSAADAPVAPVTATLIRPRSRARKR
jgi:tetratricopeptide (TPR) repeat protein